MKTIPVCLIVSGLLSSVTLHAQASEEPQGAPWREKERQGPRRHFMETWKAADKDADGLLTLEEFKALTRIQKLPEEKQRHLFERLDKNADGRLAREELRRIGGPHDGQGVPQRFWELDTNKSGGVSFEEFKQGHMFQKLPSEKQLAVFHRLDSDGDGQITPKDKPKRPFMHRHGDRPCDDDHGAPGPGPRKMLRQLDKNDDGAVSFEEFGNAPWHRQLSEDEQEDRFEALDRNQDGKLTAEDFLARGQRNGDARPDDRPQRVE